MEVIVLILSFLTVFSESLPTNRPKVLVVKCPEAKTGFPSILEHPTNCNEFFICSGLKPVLKTCPEGLVFDANVRVCNWAWAVDCRQKDGAKENAVVVLENQETQGQRESTEEVFDTQGVKSNDEKGEDVNVILETKVIDNNDLSKEEGVSESENTVIILETQDVEPSAEKDKDVVFKTESIQTKADGEETRVVETNEKGVEEIRERDNTIVVMVTKGIKSRDDVSEDANVILEEQDVETNDEADRSRKNTVVVLKAHVVETTKEENEDAHIGEYDGNGEQFYDSSGIDREIFGDIFGHPNKGRDQDQVTKASVAEINASMNGDIKINDKKDTPSNDNDRPQIYDSSDSEILGNGSEHQTKDSINDGLKETVNVGNYNDDNTQFALYDTRNIEVFGDISEYQNEDVGQAENVENYDFERLKLNKNQLEDIVQGTDAAIVETYEYDRIEINDEDYDNYNAKVYDNIAIKIQRDSRKHQDQAIVQGSKGNVFEERGVEAYSKINVGDYNEHDSEHRVQEKIPIKHCKTCKNVKSEHHSEILHDTSELRVQEKLPIKHCKTCKIANMNEEIGIKIEDVARNMRNLDGIHFSERDNLEIWPNLNKKNGVKINDKKYLSKSEYELIAHCFKINVTKDDCLDQWYKERWENGLTLFDTKYWL